MSENRDAELDELMKLKFNRIKEMQENPQARADILTKQYVDILDRLLGGTADYMKDYEELLKVRKHAKEWGLKFTFDVKVKSI